MAINQMSKYEVDLHIAEIYDTVWETEAPEVEQILGYVAGCGPRRVLEPFCGTGRILIPLAQAGHELVGMDLSHGFLTRLREKLAREPEEVQRRVTIIEADVLSLPWPAGFDVVFMGGNCLWQLGSAEEQEQVLASAASALKVGGYLYLDNDILDGDLPESWAEPGVYWRDPHTCADGTQIAFGNETIYCDRPGRLQRRRNLMRVTSPQGEVTETEVVVQNRPVGLAETRGWLTAHGFVPEQAMEREGRATYWARRER